MVAEVYEREDGEALKGRDLGPGMNFRAMPLGTDIFQLGPTSERFQNLQKYCHQLRHNAKLTGVWGHLYFYQSSRGVERPYNSKG